MSRSTKCSPDAGHVVRARPAGWSPSRASVSTAKVPRRSSSQLSLTTRPARLHPGDLVGQPAARLDGGVGQVAHPHPAIGALREVDQDLVVVQREPELLQLAIQPVHRGACARPGGYARHAARPGKASGARRCSWRQSIRRPLPARRPRHVRADRGHRRSLWRGAMRKVTPWRMNPAGRVSAR